MLGGLGLMGSGVVRFKNSLSQLIQTLVVIPHGLIVFAFLIYPLVFPARESFGLHFLFQLLFYLIAQVILIGVWAERMRFSKMLLFVNLWGVLIYLPISYLSWHETGFFHKAGLVDFAGGLVVHVTTGFSALAMTYLGRRRLDYFKLIKNYNNPQIFVGLILLWLGWMGFNAGSATGFNESAKIAILSTFVAPMGSLLIWFWIDLIHTPHRSYLSHLSMAIVAGLVMITPSAGLVSARVAFLIGLLAGFLGNYSLRFMHKVFNQDDVMEVFSTHGFVGLWGTALAGLFCGGEISLTYQMTITFAVAIYSFLMSFLMIKVLGIERLLVNEDQEQRGLDLIDHGEYVENRPLSVEEGH